MPKDPNDIGALWINKDKNGNDYFSGNVNGVAVAVFKNRYKKESKQPDYVVKKSTQKPKEDLEI